MQHDIEKYLASGQLVEIIYLDRHGCISKRRLRIHSVRDGHVKAYCFSRHAYRVFTVENILAVFPVVKRDIG